MLKNKKILIAIVVVVLGALGGAYETVLKAAPPKKPKPKIEGELVPLADPFTINLAGGHYGRISVSLLLKEAPAAAMNGEGANVIVLPQNDAVRSIITDDLTGISAERLVSRAARGKLLTQILRDLKKSTDEPVTQVMFTDLAVQ